MSPCATFVRHPKMTKCKKNCNSVETPNMLKQKNKKNKQFYVVAKISSLLGDTNLSLRPTFLGKSERSVGKPSIDGFPNRFY